MLDPLDVIHKPFTKRRSTLTRRSADDKTFSGSMSTRKSTTECSIVIDKIDVIDTVACGALNIHQQDLKNRDTENESPNKNSLQLRPKRKRSVNIPDDKSTPPSKKIKVRQDAALENKVDENSAERRSAQMEYLKKFMDISVQYSLFLEKKVGTSDNSASTSATKNTKTDREDIIKQLRYFKGELRPYQIEGVTWLTVLFENSVNGILADEMGLGKTIQIIALFCHLYERKVPGPFLIVAPLSTLANWQSEFEFFAPQLPVVCLQGDPDERHDQMKKIRAPFKLEGRTVKPVVVCSFQLPLKEGHFLKEFNWQYIVVDEGHRIKNVKSKLSIELRALSSVNRILLTGTPLQNNITELWALFNFLMPTLFQNKEMFSTLIELDDLKDRVKLLENEAENHIIATMHKILSPFMLRREKKFVIKDMVPKKEVLIYCPLTEMQKYLYVAALKNDFNKLTMGRYVPEEYEDRKNRKARQKEVNYEDNDTLDSECCEYVKMDTIDQRVKEALKPNLVAYDKKRVPVDIPNCMYVCNITLQNIVVMLKNVVNHPYLVWYPVKPGSQTRELYITEDLIKHSGKLMVLDALLPKLKERGHKVLLFSTSVMFMDMVEEMILMRKYKYRRLDGSMKYADRNQSINDFMHNSNVFLFLISTRAGGLGLNLTAADTVIFLDRDWNPMADLQAQDRCHRIGQTKPVVVYSLIARGTIDELILDCGEMKKLLEKIIITEGKFQTIKKNFNGDEVRELEKIFRDVDQHLKINPNGLIYTDQQLEEILDRSDLIAKMKISKEN